MIKPAPSQRCRDGSTNIYNVIYHINRWKERNYTVITVNSENAVIKIKYLILIKVTRQTENISQHNTSNIHQAHRQPYANR